MGARLFKPIRKAASKKPSQKESPPQRSAQDRFLRQMIDEHRKVAVFLASGIKLEGEIVSYDQYVILMKGTATDNVYKHAVSTIQPLEDGSQKPRAKPRTGTPGTPTIIRRSRPKLIKNSTE